MPATAEIYTCLNESGQTVFTDNIHACKKSPESPASTVRTIKLKAPNLHSKYGQHLSEEYYNYSFRAYESIAGHKIPIIAEKHLIDHDSEILELAAKKLEQTVIKALSLFPAGLREEFDEVRYFIFDGKESRTGGRKGGFWYFPSNNNTSVFFNNSIVIRSAKDYLNYPESGVVQALVHELSHAYFYYHYENIAPGANKAFLNIQQQGLYSNVKTRSGRVIKKAYALTNYSEYFAELTKTVLAGNHHYPYNGADLNQYDPLGYLTVKSALAKQW